MRRKDKEITERDRIDAIIYRAKVCRLALSRDNRPYVVPLSFGYDGKSLYFHSAESGMKIDFLRDNPEVCFEITADCKVKGGKIASDWTMRYISVIGFGRARFLEDPQSKRQGLAVLFKQYTEEPFEAPERTIEKTAVIRVDISSITGKISGY